MKRLLKTVLILLLIAALTYGGLRAGDHLPVIRTAAAADSGEGQSVDIQLPGSEMQIPGGGMQMPGGDGCGAEAH